MPSLAARHTHAISSIWGPASGDGRRGPLRLRGARRRADALTWLAALFPQRCRCRAGRPLIRFAGPAAATARPETGSARRVQRPHPIAALGVRGRTRLARPLAPHPAGRYIKPRSRRGSGGSARRQATEMHEWP
jgi:hypothetical protein